LIGALVDRHRDGALGPAAPLVARVIDDVRSA